MSDTAAAGTAPASGTVPSGATAPQHKRGGMYFGDFAAGQIFEHCDYRTVAQMDDMLFSNVTLNPKYRTGIGGLIHCYNQDDKPVAECRRSAITMRLA
jgi:hypothetical protein